MNKAARGSAGSNILLTAKRLRGLVSDLPKLHNLIEMHGKRRESQDRFIRKVLLEQGYPAS